MANNSEEIILTKEYKNGIQGGKSRQTNWYKCHWFDLGTEKRQDEDIPLLRWKLFLA